MHLKFFAGNDARPYFEEIASLRITMFREFPYLYDGSLEDERPYLEGYFASPNALIALAFDGAQVVAFFSAIPLAETFPEIQAPFLRHGLDVGDFLYIGETMIQEPYRRRGLLRKVFQRYEAYAKEIGCTKTLFITVQRPLAHPLRPACYRPLEPVWERLGYRIDPRLAVQLSWKQIDTTTAQENTLDTWIKSLKTPAPRKIDKMQGIV